MPLDSTTPSIDPGLQQLVDEMNAKAGYTKARIHTGELMKPAGHDEAMMWSQAYDQAVHAAFAVCRKSTSGYGGPHIGDWFNVTRRVPVAALPAALKIGVGIKFSTDFKRRVPIRQFCMIRLPLARFWNHTWRPIIAKAIIESGGP